MVNIKLMTVAQSMGTSWLIGSIEESQIDRLPPFSLMSREHSFTRSIYCGITGLG